MRSPESSLFSRLFRLRPIMLLCAGLSVSGCALQADVMEIGLDMEEIQDLQRKLEGQLAKAEESAETVRAMRVRMDTVEEKLKEGINPELETRINVGLRTMERTQRQLTAARVQVEERLNEAEKFFVEQVKSVSGKQAEVDSRVASMEARLGAALRGQRSAPASGSSEKAAANDPYLKWLDDRLTQLTKKISSVEQMSEDTVRKLEAPKEAPVDPRVDMLMTEVRALKKQVAEGGGALTPQQISLLTERLEPRVAALEKLSAEKSAAADELQQKRLDQIAEAVDLRLAQLEEQQNTQTQPVNQLATRLAQQEQALSSLDQRIAELSATMEGTTGPTAAQLVQLAQRVDGMELRTQNELARIKETLQPLVEKIGPGGPSSGEAAALAGLSGQMELLAASLDERLLRLERAATVSASQQQVAAHVDARFQELEPRLQKISDRMALLEQTQMADMAELSQQVVATRGKGGEKPSDAAATPQVLEQLSRQQQAIMLLERRLAAVQTDPQVAFLTEQVENLSRKLDEQAKRADGQPAGTASQPDAELLARLERQEALMNRMEQRLTALQADPQSAFLTDRVESLSRDVDARLAELEARTRAAEKPQSTRQADTAALAGMSGQMALLEASLGDRIERLERQLAGMNKLVEGADQSGNIEGLDKRLSAVGERIQQLEQDQMAEMTALRQQLMSLTKAVAESRNSASSP